MLLAENLLALIADLLEYGG